MSTHQTIKLSVITDLTIDHADGGKHPLSNGNQISHVNTGVLRFFFIKYMFCSILMLVALVSFRAGHWAMKYSTISSPHSVIQIEKNVGVPFLVFQWVFCSPYLVTSIRILIVVAIIWPDPTGARSVHQPNLDTWPNLVTMVYVTFPTN